MVEETNGDETNVVLPVLDCFKESLKTFLQSVRQVASRKGVPGWFNDFSKHIRTFANYKVI